jgi:hypothetical protein
MWIAIVEAYNKTIDAVFRILDWMKGRPRQKLKERREELEAESRQHQLNGDLDGLRRVRAELKEIDRMLNVGDS